MSTAKLQLCKIVEILLSKIQQKGSLGGDKTKNQTHVTEIKLT